MHCNRILRSSVLLLLLVYIFPKQFALATHINVSHLSRFNTPKRNESVQYIVHQPPAATDALKPIVNDNDKFPIKSSNNYYYRIHNGTVRSMIVFHLKSLYSNDRTKTTMNHAEVDRKILNELYSQRWQRLTCQMHN